jgi:hypothetical protein
MPDTQVKVVPPGLLWRIILRFASIIVAATIFSCLINLATKGSGQLDTPAGFGKGLVHGAIMPASMFNLLIGNDVTIYAKNNNGRMYKLGYTTGVNTCGALFFGFFFWRITRWKKQFGALQP